MQTGADSRSRQVVLNPSTPTAGALGTPDAMMEGVPSVGQSGSGEEFVRHRSALLGMRVALPLALWLWGLIAALIWACRP